eukprot:TRINITY_DN51758_c0_g1_i1.p1 TRINITY_DN51758_c0_g1~~TRINITY_DN51758_c0_g1_i1.p1  ORF type:complete len:331 (+),score=134.11 TRINITY_DN51758_c0_g1_i1:91-993(+)
MPAFSIAQELGGAASVHATKVSAGLAVFGESDSDDEDHRAGRLAAALGEAGLPPAEELEERRQQFEPYKNKPLAIATHGQSAFPDSPPASPDGSPHAGQMPSGSAEAAHKTMAGGIGQAGAGGCGSRRMSQRLQFSEGDIRHMHKLFHTYAPDGKMGKAEFAKYMQEHSGLQSDADGYEQMFRAYDRNRDGTIVFREYLEYLHGVKFCTQELIDIVFATFDADSDGYVTRDELLKAVTNSTKWRGELDVGSASTQQLIEREVDKIISFLDTDKDGRVSTHELASAAEQHPEVLSALRQLL